MQQKRRLTAQDSLARSTDTLHRLSAAFGGGQLDCAKTTNRRHRTQTLGPMSNVAPEPPATVDLGGGSLKVQGTRSCSDDLIHCGAKTSRAGLLAVQNDCAELLGAAAQRGNAKMSWAESVSARTSCVEIATSFIKPSSSEEACTNMDNMEDLAMSGGRYERQHKRVRINVSGVVGRGIAKAVAAGWASVDSQLKLAVSPRSSSNRSNLTEPGSMFLEKCYYVTGVTVFTFLRELTTNLIENCYVSICIIKISLSLQ